MKKSIKSTDIERYILAESTDIGPTDRERYILAESIRAAALAADSAFSALDGERTYGHGEMVLTAKKLTEGHNKLSRNQLENLQAFVELALKTIKR